MALRDGGSIRKVGPSGLESRKGRHGSQRAWSDDRHHRLHDPSHPENHATSLSAAAASLARACLHMIEYGYGGSLGAALFMATLHKKALQCVCWTHDMFLQIALPP